MGPRSPDAVPLAQTSHLLLYVTESHAFEAEISQNGLYATSSPCAFMELYNEQESMIEVLTRVFIL